MKQSLQASEWILVASLLVLMGSIILVAKIGSFRASAILATCESAPEVTEITIFVEGAVVEPVQLTVPAGSRICDLKSKILLTAEAEKAFFRRRKKLKSGEIIIVPKKTVE